MIVYKSRPDEAYDQLKIMTMSWNGEKNDIDNVVMR
jgi:hypothetical protein